MLSFLKSTHILLCGGSPGEDFFGTITTGDAQGEMLFVMIPALSRVLISFLTHSWCFSGRVYGLDAIGGLLPVSMSISTSSVLPMSSLPLEIMQSNLLHRLLNLSLVSSLIGASFRSTFRCGSTSAGDLMKFEVLVKILCIFASVMIGALLAFDRDVRFGTHILGVVSNISSFSTSSMSKTSPLISSLSANATT